MTAFTESIVEEATLGWFGELGYGVLHGPGIALGEPGAERATYGDVVLLGRLRAALARLNPRLPADALEEACRKLTRPDHPSLLENNRRFHHMLVDGVPVSYQGEGRTVHDFARVLDFDTPGANEFLAVNQFTVIENGHNRRPDILLFVNGLPLAVIELKNAADANATVKHAFNQLQTYKHDIPLLFPTNALLVISDGLQAKAGTLTSDWERFQPWRTVDGTEPPASMTPLETLIKGMFAPHRLLDLVQNFIVFEIDGAEVQKKVAAYHQYHAVNKAVEATVRASAPSGDRRIGVVWHTQGSGKSLSMVFYAGKLARQKEMQNPTLVVLTDRNDLDDQLFSTFARCQDLIGQAPEQVTTRAGLRAQLRRASGGIVFTTLQKFTPEDRGDSFPLLSDRRNIVVIADESHRSQYGFDAKVVKKGDEEAYIKYGYAKYLRDAIPHASFIGFTGTPIERADANTRAVFGDYIDIYDISRAVEDGATVRIFYEGRLAKLELEERERPHIDPEFEEVTEGEEISVKERLKRKWAQMEAMVGTPKRLRLIARDIVEHFEARQSAMQGKAMIVCMSRRICADLYAEIIRLHPEWHSPDDDKGGLKVVMTGSASDEPSLQQHVRNKAGREAIAKRFKNPDDPLQLVIVRDMWLTGFDVPCLHTMYVDKPMKGSGLMQAIARVNRVFRDKPGGLIVDYLGIADQLKQALAEYTASDRNQAGVPQEVAVAKLEELIEVTAAMFHGFDPAKFWTGSPAERLTVLLAAQNHVLTLDDGKKRYVQTVTELGRAFALAVPHEKALELRELVGFYQAVKAGLLKTLLEGETSPDDLHTAVRQIVSKAVTSNEVIDIFGAAGMDKPEISILSDEFLAEVQGLEYKNLALEALRKLLSDQIRAHARTNLVQSRQFSQMLEEAIRRLQNRSLETAQVIAELVELAKELRTANQRGEKLGLTEEELAFYDALEVNASAVQVLGDDTLRAIARELVQSVRNSVTIDWNVKESARARLRLLVKRILRKYKYPPDKQEQATTTVLEQTELLCSKWL